MIFEFSPSRKIFKFLFRVLTYEKGYLTMPIHLGLHITDKCPHSCPECNGGRNLENPSELSYEDCAQVIEKAAECGIKAVTFGGGGDPLAHKDFVKIASLITKSNMKFGVLTNGAIMKQDVADFLAENATWIRISLDAGSSELYRKTHGRNADFETTLNNIAKIGLNLSRKCAVGVSYLTSSETRKDIAISAELAKFYGADYIIYRPFDGNADIPYQELEEAKKAEDNNFMVTAHYERIKSKCRSYSVCHGMMFVIEIAPDGNVYPCCHFKNLRINSYGNIKTQKLNDLIFKGALGNAQKSIDVSKCPPHCRNHILNESIENIIKPVSHEAFL